MWSYLLPAILTFCGGLSLWLIRRPRPALHYEVIESEPFPVERQLFKYFVIRLLNFGNTALQNIDLQITFSSGTIQSHKTSDETITCERDSKRNQLTTRIPLLNPRDRFQVTATIESQAEIASPTVLARCVGVTATSASEGIGLFHQVATILMVVTAGLLAVMLGNTLLSWWTSRQQEELSSVISRSESTLQNLPQKSRELEDTIERLRKIQAEAAMAAEIERKKHDEGKPETPEVIFAVINRAGLGHLMPNLVMFGDEPQYWKTGLFLMHSFLKDETNGDKYLNAISALMTEEEHMAPSSYGFLAYLAGKIEQKLGRNAQAMEFFERCKKKTPLMYEHLMAQDPSYDLNSLQAFLRKSELQSPRPLPNASGTP
jgi:cell division protein FtsB